MITLKLNNSYEIPTSYEELRPFQYLEVCKAITDFLAGKYDFEAFRYKVLFSLLDLTKVKKISDTLCQNIYRIGEQINFYYRYVYEDKRFNFLSEQAREKLAHELPRDTDESPEMRIASQFKYHVKIDLYFGEQLLPFLDSMRLIGYKFHYCNGIVDTSLTASQYTDANTLIAMFYNSKQERPVILDRLVKTLYCPEPYSASKAEKVDLKAIPLSTKVAVLYNYNAIIDWIADIVKYRFIFHGAKSSGKNMIGPNSPIYQLAEKGYGSVKEIEEMSLFNYFDLLIKETIDSVVRLSDLEMKHAEIASATGLTDEQVDEIINNNKK